MTIERNMFIDKPVLATVDEGMLVAEKRYQNLVRQDSPPGTIMRMHMPQGEHSLLPRYLRDHGYNFTLQVLESGRGAVLINETSQDSVHVLDAVSGNIAKDTRTIRLPEDTTGFPLILESEDGENLELHEFIIHREGPNPPKERISIT